MSESGRSVTTPFAPVPMNRPDVVPGTILAVPELPVGSVVLDAGETAYQNLGDGRWMGPSEGTGPLRWCDLIWDQGPLTVLHVATGRDWPTPQEDPNA